MLFRSSSFGRYIEKTEGRFLGEEGGWEKVRIEDQKRSPHRIWFRKFPFWITLWLSTLGVSWYEIFWVVEKLPSK
jgi:hypothetical protein